MTSPEPEVPATELIVALEPEAPLAAPEEPVATVESEVTAEDASDAQLRAWAKENGIEDVPASGKLSAAWRETITTAMAAALATDPKVEATVEETSPESSTSLETTTEETTGGEETSPPTEEEPVVEYRTPWVAPETWVTGQAYTA